MKINYPEMYIKVYKNKGFCSFLRVISAIAVAVAAASVFLALIAAWLGDGIDTAVKLAAVLLIPFILVSLARRAVNLKRPSEVFDLRALGIDTQGFKRGFSFPSRHVFSGFLIGTALIMSSAPAVGIVVLVLSALLGAARVLLGIHFLRDVIAGALVGAFSAVAGILIIGV